MFEGYRVVCVTPAGRRRYMELLAPYVLGSDIVDRYDIWMNTGHPADCKFLESLAKLPRVRLVAHPAGAKPSTESIGGFHPTATDADTIYIRLDDDVVWLEPGFFETLLRFRLARPEHFMVMPLIINNALCSFLLQSLGKVQVSRPLGTSCFDPVGWRDPRFALQLHRFLLDLIQRGETHKLHAGPHVSALVRFSINSLCWFGRDMAPVARTITVEEELDLSAVIPARLGRTNCFCTDTIAAHFAFFSQRAKLDGAGILEQYAAVLSARTELAELAREIGALRRAADRHEPVLPSAQGGFAPTRKPSLLQRLMKARAKPAKRPQVTLSSGPGLG
jgi:hypothetical protein